VATEGDLPPPEPLPPIDVESVAPALVIVLEAEGPVRVHTTAMTDDDRRRLAEWITSHEKRLKILTAALETHRATQGGDA
jgi:hypothetical protein